MTTAYLVNEWEKHCEATDGTEYAQELRETASGYLKKAQEMMDKVRDMVASAAEYLEESEETQPEFDRVVSLQEALDELFYELGQNIENMR